ncbi:MAG: methyltransferase domain-containing protein [Candidatus Tectimicrobiota bacterium]
MTTPTQKERGGGPRASSAHGPSPLWHRRSTCRVCKGTELVPFLSLGDQPLANHFLTEEELATSEARFPLVAYYCEGCGLAQLLDVVEPELLFRDYPYFSSASQPLVDHFARAASEIAQRYLHGPDDVVCEIGSNDGVFLKNFRGTARIVGVDPAENIAAIANDQGVPTQPEFFTGPLAEDIRRTHGEAKVIFAANVFASIDDLDEVMKGVRTLLRPDGVFILEVHRLADILRNKCFDQIYHEHLSYFTIQPLTVLMDRFGMRIFDVQKIPVHGESFRLHVAKTDSQHVQEETVAKIGEEESRSGLTDLQTYLSYAEEVEELKTRLRKMVRSLQSDGKRIVGYGAPAKGNILLNFCEIDRTMVEYIIDTTPTKQGLFTPGSRIPIYPPEKLQEERPDYLLLLAWNYADYILDKEQWLIDQHVKFIIPIPDPIIVQYEN